MKSLLIFLLVTIVFVACKESANKTTQEPVKDIVGFWDAHLEHEGKPYVLSARIKADGTYDGFIDDKPFVSAKYRLSNDTFYTSDGLCGMDYEGIYLVKFYSDSVRFDVIEDSCTERRMGSDKMALKKVPGK